MFLNPERSFVWVSAANAESAWQVDSQLHDSQVRLPVVNLKRNCLGDQLEGLGWRSCFRKSGRLSFQANQVSVGLYPLVDCRVGYANRIAGGSSLVVATAVESGNRKPRWTWPATTHLRMLTSLIHPA